MMAMIQKVLLSIVIWDEENPNYQEAEGAMYYEIKRNLRTLAFGQQHLTLYQNWDINQMIEQKKVC